MEGNSIELTTQFATSKPTSKLSSKYFTSKSGAKTFDAIPKKVQKLFGMNVPDFSAKAGSFHKLAED